MRVIAGDYRRPRGPARTFTPIDVWDVRLKRRRKTAEADAARRRAPPALVVLRGTVHGQRRRSGARGAAGRCSDRAGAALPVEANSDATLLLLSGEPIDEPIVGHGPFVMNSREEILQAMKDFNAGRLGRMAG